MFYTLTEQSPVELAKNALISQGVDIEQQILDFSYEEPEPVLPPVMSSGFSPEKTAELNEEIEAERHRIYEGGYDDPKV